jgi:hypothetical protein
MTYQVAKTQAEAIVGEWFPLGLYREQLVQSIASLLIFAYKKGLADERKRHLRDALGAARGRGPTPRPLS